MTERLTWKEIQEKYPDQWVGLVDIDWKNSANVRSAVVKYTDKSCDELFLMGLHDEPDLHSFYTTPDNVPFVGVNW